MPCELLPCPFCGGVASLEGGDNDEWYILCTNVPECGCAPFYDKTKRGVLKLWNRRAKRVETVATGAQQPHGKMLCPLCKRDQVAHSVNGKKHRCIYCNHHWEA